MCGVKSRSLLGGTIPQSLHRTYVLSLPPEFKFIMSTTQSEIEKKYDIYVNEHTGHLIQHLNSARKERRLCDFIIKVGSEHIHVHRLVLSEGCDYFRGMFSPGMKESQSRDVEMKGVNPECMTICIEYIYTGRVSVQMSKIHPLLKVAQMLLLTGLYDALVAFLDQHLDAESFFVTRDLACTFELTELQKKCEQYGEENFEAISQQEGFQRIDKKLLISLVTSEGNKAPEGIKLKSIFRWIKSEPEARKKYLRELHKHVDFAKVPVEYRRKLIEDEPLVHSCSELIRRISISVMDTANIESGDVGAVGGTTVQQPNVSALLLPPPALTTGVDYMLLPPPPICQTAIDNMLNIALPPTQTGIDNNITVDTNILAFMQLVKAQDLQRIWDSNGVKINVTTEGDDSNIEFLKLPSARLPVAVDQFQRMYRHVNDTCCKEMYYLGRLFRMLSDQNVEDVIRYTRSVHKNVHITRMCEDKDQVLFIAETMEGCDAAIELFARRLKRKKRIRN